ncbi:prolyl-tRNA editing enzyme YbaK/EbsC (Cys-tRNA(Pro) deacylase) [Stackebrandtia albiflava]|uniref:Prolyl-tRNA editing enzyme YbaK/EbsC (Cys-tRNA(Pro) deacylase) n=1 Tax=Stackebrandtia albiflava TaxID=406432 RepID=A0A562V1Q5_9ACTN|nr:YbaK/EbsC family protein [Stackebrandtia albiflava]TWJ11775.1 prolyl-tRNA editing enzyme YbaK/EbsC (Cys-tRNA(Pro) deacylase) [Stackebrandtia albiflava]
MRRLTVAGRVPATEAVHLLAAPVKQALSALPGADAGVMEIDADFADTAAFCERYGIPLDASANCVIVAGKRGETVGYAACMALATTRVNVNTVVRRRMGARKASFAPMADAVEMTGMEYGGITPVGLPADWPVLVDRAVAEAGEVVVGSGIRGSKLIVTGEFLAALPGAEVVDDLAS